MTKIDDLTRLKHIKQAIVEAANKISDEKQNQYSQIPWRRMIGMRNRLTHAYFEVDLDIVWQVINQDLPNILPQIEIAILDLENEAV